MKKYKEDMHNKLIYDSIINCNIKRKYQEDKEDFKCDLEIDSSEYVGDEEDVNMSETVFNNMLLSPAAAPDSNSPAHTLRRRS